MTETGRLQLPWSKQRLPQLLVLVCLSQLKTCNADVVPGTLLNDASILEAQHGMLAQERRLSRIAIMDAFRSPRRAVLNTVMDAGEGLRQLPESNALVHKRLMNLTKTTHDYMKKEVDGVEKYQMDEAGDALAHMNDRTKAAVDMFEPQAEKSMQLFQKHASSNILKKDAMTDVNKFYMQRQLDFDKVIDQIDAYEGAEAIQMYNQKHQQELVQIMSRTQPLMYDKDWSNAFEGAIAQETEDRAPVYQILKQEVPQTNYDRLHKVNDNITARHKVWEDDVARFHEQVNTTLESRPVQLKEGKRLQKSINRVQDYDGTKSIPTLFTTIITFLGGVHDYLEFIYPFLRNSNFLALLLLSIALVLLLAILLLLPMLLLVERWQSFRRQQREYERYRAKAARACPPLGR